jgi:hypothetical protein
VQDARNLLKRNNLFEADVAEDPRTDLFAAYRMLDTMIHTLKISDRPHHVEGVDVVQHAIGHALDRLFNVSRSV